jgi:hypothetical protein
MGFWLLGLLDTMLGSSMAGGAEFGCEGQRKGKRKKWRVMLMGNERWEVREEGKDVGYEFGVSEVDRGRGIAVHQNFRRSAFQPPV